MIRIFQEKIEEAGLDLPQLYKMFEKELPELCTTEAWKKRTHWAGLTPTAEVYEVVQQAELDLKEKRPVRRCKSFFNHLFL
jgi:transcriptional regulator ATRX